MILNLRIDRADIKFSKQPRRQTQDIHFQSYLFLSLLLISYHRDGFLSSRSTQQRQQQILTISRLWSKWLQYLNIKFQNHNRTQHQTFQNMMMMASMMTTSRSTIKIFTCLPHVGGLHHCRLFSSSAIHNNVDNNNKRLGTLRVIGQDRHGIVAACTQVLGVHGCNIIKSEQWTDPKNHMFFQRLEFHYPLNSVDKIKCQNELSHKFQVLQQQQTTTTNNPIYHRHLHNQIILFH